MIETLFHDGHSSPDVLKNFANAIPMGRLGTAEECVGAFLFLASEGASGYVTGGHRSKRRAGDALRGWTNEGAVR